MYGKVGAIEKMATSNSKYTEDWLPIVSITNGMINLKNKYKVTGVKIVPRNIFILDPESQDAALIALKNFYNLCDFEFWIVAADRPVDISLYVSQLQLLYNQTQKPYIRKLVMEDLDKAQMYINNEVVDTEYYLLFKEKDNDKIQKRIRMIINNLASCGLSCSQTSNEDLRVLLDNFLNGGDTARFGTVMPA